MADPAAHDVRFHGLVGKDLLAPPADYDAVWLLEHLGQVVQRDVFGQVVVPIAAAVERHERRPT